ncbi:PREDICTED: probable serine/threonine-protein kinase DDB_G0282963 [Camelina sativa]|uniref:Probable serine/threonine-protein kinase DDB_G0282963 n=1 Tax=Camelina sativa TaxID=90675 RepID=A0ABM0UTK2_CAMSA|nr:PREDICTED: probable serine/threonine-protein kinase DDB_G0282963 [Camelina sativa]
MVHPLRPTTTTLLRRNATTSSKCGSTTPSPLLFSTPSLKTRSSARQIWISIENFFHDNKEARAIQLDTELCSLTIGDLSVHDYCQKLKTLSDLLANVDSPVTERVVVMHMLNGLTEKYDNINNIIRHRQPFPSFATAPSMLVEEEHRLFKQIKTGTSTSIESSSHSALYTFPGGNHNNNSNNSNPRHNNPHGGNYNGCRGRGRGRSYNGRGRGRQQWNWGNNWRMPPPWFQTPASAPQ